MIIGNNLPKLAALALLLLSSLITPQAQIHATPVQADINNVAELIGQEVVFTGQVENVRQIASGTTFMDFGGRHPHAAFTCVAFASKAHEIGDLFQYNGKTIQVRGIVAEFNGKPQIVLQSHEQIHLLHQDNKSPDTPTAQLLQKNHLQTPTNKNSPAPTTTATTESKTPHIGTNPTPARSTGSATWYPPSYLEGIRPGWPKEFTVDLTPDEIAQIPKDELPLLEPKSAKGALVIPPNFDPAKNYNVFIVYSTCDGGGAHVNSGIKMFASTLSDNGWVGIAAQGHQLKKMLSNTWNLIMTRAVINYISRDIPGLRSWKFYVGGNSGGAHRSGSMAPLLKKEGLDIVGVFLAGSGSRNNLLESMARQKLRPRDFMPAIYISHGKQDNVAVLAGAISLENSFRNADFKQIKTDHFEGGHDLNRESVARALQWFAAVAPPEKRR